MDSPLLKYSAKDYFFKAALCHFCIDMLNAKVAHPTPAGPPHQATMCLSPGQVLLPPKRDVLLPHVWPLPASLWMRSVVLTAVFLCWHHLPTRPWRLLRVQLLPHLVLFPSWVHFLNPHCTPLKSAPLSPRLMGEDGEAGTRVPCLRPHD